MLIPIIKINDNGHIHVVGTNSHDVLFVDQNTGGIQYLNLQCMEGTRKHSGKSEMSFVSKKPEEWDIYPTIEMITVEELIEIATKNMVEQTEASIRLHESFKKYLDAKNMCEEKRRDDDVSDTSGMLF
ncbi:MAG TPA: hypothetical protein DEG06_05130 [Lachnospiraceae bacterium]|jgi:hypothetical protein|nr:hypothetical protein [Lachnospiraceae bacterium]HBY71607.1 hypothetical protein [Lachnospiraceae bacterium]HCA69352.1 hypothetical protein [Lachnospiraceae bacterium]